MAASLSGFQQGDRADTPVGADGNDGPLARSALESLPTHDDLPIR